MLKNRFYVLCIAAPVIFFASAFFYYIFLRSNFIPLKVLFGSPQKSAPTISPDGKKLVYIAPINGVRNIWVRTLGKNDDEAVTTQQERDITSCFWSCDNEHLFYMRDKGGDENYHLYMANVHTKKQEDVTPFEGTKVFVETYRKQFPNEMLISMNKRDKKVFDVYRFDLKTKTLTLVAENPGDFVDWVADWDNKIRGAVASTKDGGRDGFVRDDEGSPWRNIVSWSFEEAKCKFIGFSKDGTQLFVRDSRGVNTLRLVSIDTKTGDMQIVGQDPNYDFGSVVRDDDTGEILAGYVRKEKKELVFFDKDFETDLRLVMVLGTGQISLRSKDMYNKKWIVSFVRDDGPISYWLFNRETKKGEFLFYAQPALSAYKLACMEPISFMARDGLKIHGYMTCPVGMIRKNLPLILLVHGGPWSRDSWGYVPTAQWLANRGYAVLQVNYRGSSGYGKNFINAGNKEWGAKMHGDLVDAVHWAIEHGIVDPKKVAIFGGSYGGYAALVGATFTPDLFCCAIDLVGPSNLVTLMKSFPPYWSVVIQTMYRRVGDPEKDKEFLESRSPLFKADKIKIPIMVVQGANDPRVKQAEAEQIVQAMKKNNVQYEYMLFEDEGHGLLKEENRMKFFVAAEKFLKKHMG